jgi:F420-non-reducing hydrogenase small subunit
VFFDTVKTLDQVVDVDYYIPGCPPTPNIIESALGALLTGNLPPKGSVLAPDRALCEECPRKDSKPEKLAIQAFHRPSEVMIDETQCILSQGVPCLGPATRSGCGAQCVQANMPCTGCFGPTSRVRDAGVKSLSAIASMVASNEEAEIEMILAGVPDLVGTFYRYSLPASSLRRKREEAA